MTIPYSLVVIKPLSVGRGDAPNILQSFLDNRPVTLRKFRSWAICDTTLLALVQDKGLHKTNLDYDQEKLLLPRQIDSWICVFTHLDRQTDPTPIIHEYCGPLNRREWLPHHLRHQFGGYSRFGNNAHPTDTVIHIAKPERALYEANLLFLNFNEIVI